MKKVLSIILVLVLMMSLSAVAFADGEGFAVTKHPTSETVSAGSKVLFVSYPNAAVYDQYWYFEDGAGQVIPAENLPNYYAGVRVEFDGTKLRLLNVAEEMNGISVYAVFVREGVEIRSNYANLYVTPGTRCAETASPCAETATVSCLIAISKQPVDETKLNCRRSETYFSVGGSNIARVEWFCKIGKTGTEMSVAEAISEYGVSAEGYDTCKLILYSNSAGWEGINGWMWRAKLYDCNGNYTYSKWVTTMVGWCGEPEPPCQPCTPCIPCVPVCQQPCQPVCQPVYQPTCGYGGWGYLETTYDSTTTTHTETDTTITQHGFSVQPWY